MPPLTARPLPASRPAPYPAGRVAHVCTATSEPDAPTPLTRRSAIASTSAAALVSLLGAAAAALPPPPAAASKLPAAVDAAWASVTGAPPDLFFPPAFAGTFDARSTLISAEAPLGEAALPPAGAAALARARAEDLGVTISYRARWIPAPRPPAGAAAAGGEDGGGPWVILDRAFNTASLLSATAGIPGLSSSDVAWDPSDPNDLRLTLPGGAGSVSLRVTKRSEAPGPPGSRRLETSEFSRQVFEGGRVVEGPPSPSSEGRAVPPRVTASQCFSKWHWRDRVDAVGADVEGAPGPTIIATQVVSSFLTPDDPGGISPASLGAGGGTAVAVYTYRLALTPVE